MKYLKQQMKCYIIQNSVLVEKSTVPSFHLIAPGLLNNPTGFDAVGINSYLDPNNTTKLELKIIAKQMWDHFNTYCTKYVSPVTTISLLDEDKLHILYSNGNPKTANDYELDQPLDTVDFQPMFFGEDPGFRIFRDDVDFSSFIKTFSV